MMEYRWRWNCRTLYKK